MPAAITGDGVSWKPRRSDTSAMTAGHHGDETADDLLEEHRGAEAVDPPVDAHDDDGGQEGHHRHEQAAPSSSDTPADITPTRRSTPDAVGMRGGDDLVDDPVRRRRGDPGVADVPDQPVDVGEPGEVEGTVF